MQRDLPSGGGDPGWRATVEAAMAAAQAGDWRHCQQLSAMTAEHQSPALMCVSRLNILICQYHLGSVQLIPERALPLLPLLPPGAVPACLGFALLAARKSGTLPQFKGVALGLAADWLEPLDLPSVPLFVLLHENQADCSVIEHSDGSLMSEVVHHFLESGGIDAAESAKLRSLAAKYRKRAVLMATHEVSLKSAACKRKPWWKFW